MNLLLAFRATLLAFVLLYVATLVTSGVPPDSPAEVLAYERWQLSLVTDGSPVWRLLCAVGHLLDVVGVVLLFVRRKVGLWFLVAGFMSCLGTA